MLSTFTQFHFQLLLKYQNEMKNLKILILLKCVPSARSEVLTDVLLLFVSAENVSSINS